MHLPRFALPALLLCAAISANIAHAQSDDLLERKQKIAEHDKALASPEALDRKTRTETQLTKENVPFAKSLPVIADSKQAKKRTKEEIAHRAIALCIVSMKAAGDAEQPVIDAMVKKYSAATYFSPAEAAFIKNPAPTDKEKINFSWRYEDYWVLLWALGYVDSLDFPKDQCNAEKAIALLRDHTAEEFITGAKLRDLTAILDQTDLIYRYHWVTTEARINGKESPAGLNREIIMERHYVLNWLIGYLDQEWDDISTDT